MDLKKSLPEKWYIKVGENAEIINKWKQTTEYTDPASWYTYVTCRGSGYKNKSDYTDHSEITIEQFKQYVLKEPLIPKPIKPFPTQWCIELNKENISIVGVYYNKKHLSEPNCDTYTEDGAIGQYVKSHNSRNEYVKNGYTACSFFGGPSDSYPEITLEQFKEFVMNEHVKIETSKTEKDWSKATKEELIEEAKRRYPVGTKFISAMNPELTYEVISSEFYDWLDRGTDIVVNNSSGPSVYCGGKWAEIVSLPESKVESTIEYAECIAYLCGLKVGQIYEVKDKMIGDYYYPAIGQFKPSTKEAFEEQNKPKSIEKWSVGSYIVPLQNKLLSRSEPLIKGKPYQIIGRGPAPYIICENGREINFSACSDNPETKEGIKWFATKPEAEEFAKTLVESVKHGNGILDAVDIKQPLKQAVHCKTQEEWDFVTEKLDYKWSKSSKWSYYENNTCINLEYKGFGTTNVAYKGWKILSFQEWCALNGYKMESKCDFIVGSWYKSTAKENNRGGETYYGKFLRYDNGCFTATWHSVANIFTEQVYTFINGYKWELMTDLSEIQQYLPEDHPDKIPTYKFKVGDKVEIIHAGSGCSLEGDNPIEKAHNLLDIWGKDPLHIKPIKVKSLNSTQLLSLEDEELPMVSIIKTKTVSILSIN